MIGVSDGTQYESQFEMYAAPSNKKVAGDVIDMSEPFKREFDRNRNADDKGFGQRGLQWNDQTQQWEDLKAKIIPIRPNTSWRVHEGDATMPVGASEKPAGAFNIERGYNVPLAASALTHDGESMYGVAVDHRIPSAHTFSGHTYDPAQFVALHEGAELPHMANLITGGQSAQDAYHEAHDKIATPTETAAVRAYAVKNNLNPDHFMDDYKQFWRDGAAMASEPSDKPRHPDAHTTRYGLDESELAGQKFAMNDHPPIQMDVLGSSMSFGAHAGPGKTANDNSNVKEFPVDQATKDFNINNPSKETLNAERLEAKMPSLAALKKGIVEGTSREMNWRREEKEDDKRFRDFSGMSQEDMKYFKAFIKQNPDYYNK